jgi:hypothetical protein
MYCRQQHTGVLYFGCYRQSHGTCERGVAVKASWLIPEMEHRLLERVGDARANQRGPRSAADPVAPWADEVRRIESALGHLTSLYVDGGLLDGEYREARKLQMQRLAETQKRLENAVRRSETMVRSEYVADVLAGLAGVGTEGWAALSLQAKRDVFDIVLDRVIVYPKENPRGRGQGPHKIKVLWR